MIKIHLSKVLGAKRWSQADIAKQTGIRPNTINEMYHEIIQRINIDYLDKLREALGCSVGDLLEYIPNEQQTTGTKLILEQHGHRKK